MITLEVIAFCDQESASVTLRKRIDEVRYGQLLQVYDRLATVVAMEQDNADA